MTTPKKINQFHVYSAEAAQRLVKQLQEYGYTNHFKIDNMIKEDLSNVKEVDIYDNDTYILFTNYYTDGVATFHEDSNLIADTSAGSTFKLIVAHMKHKFNKGDVIISLESKVKRLIYDVLDSGEYLLKSPNYAAYEVVKFKEIDRDFTLIENEYEVVSEKTVLQLYNKEGKVVIETAVPESRHVLDRIELTVEETNRLIEALQLMTEV